MLLKSYQQTTFTPFAPGNPLSFSIFPVLSYLENVSVSNDFLEKKPNNEMKITKITSKYFIKIEVQLIPRFDRNVIIGAWWRGWRRGRCSQSTFSMNECRIKMEQRTVQHELRGLWFQLHWFFSCTCHLQKKKLDKCGGIDSC